MTIRPHEYGLLQLYVETDSKSSYELCLAHAVEIYFTSMIDGQQGCTVSKVTALIVMHGNLFIEGETYDDVEQRMEAVSLNFAAGKWHNYNIRGPVEVAGTFTPAMREALNAISGVGAITRYIRDNCVTWDQEFINNCYGFENGFDPTKPKAKDEDDDFDDDNLLAGDE